MITQTNNIKAYPHTNNEVKKLNATDSKPSINGKKFISLKENGKQNRSLKNAIVSLSKIALITAAVAIPLISYCYYSQTSHNQHPPELKKLKPPVKHPIEIKTAEVFGDEVLTFDKNDPKPKLLYLVSSYDQQSYFDAMRDLKDTDLSYLIKGTVLGQINLRHDTRLKVINNPDEFCYEIKEAIKIGNLKSIVIKSHGKPDGIELTKDQFLTSENLKKECFDGLDSDATISLISCETGKKENGIAHAISKLSQRVVWAPNDLTSEALCSVESRFPFIPKFTGNKGGDLKSIFLVFFPPFHITQFISDATCKFSPDGSRACGFYATKIAPLF